MKTKLAFSVLFSLCTVGLYANYPGQGSQQPYLDYSNQPSYQQQGQSQNSYQNAPIPPVPGSQGQGYFSLGMNPQQGNSAPTQDPYAPQGMRQDSFSPQSYAQDNYMQQQNYNQGTRVNNQGYRGYNQNPNMNQAPKGYIQGYLGQTPNQGYYAPQNPQNPQGYNQGYNQGYQQQPGNKGWNARNNNNDLSYAQKYPRDTYATNADLDINAKIRKKFSGWFTDSFKYIILHTNNGYVIIEGFVDNDDDLRKLNDEIREIQGIRGLRLNVRVKRQ